MREITTTHLQRKIGEVLSDVQKEPIKIMSNGRERAVIVSSHEYRRLKELVGEDVPL